MGDLLPLGPDEHLTRAVRRRLDLATPLPRELIEECLQVAVQAPTGPNLQGWQVGGGDPQMRQALADLYGPSFDHCATVGSGRELRDGRAGGGPAVGAR